MIISRSAIFIPLLSFLHFHHINEKCTVHFLPAPPSNARRPCAPSQRKLCIPDRTFLRDVYLETSVRHSVLTPRRCDGLWQRLLDCCMSITVIRWPDSLQGPLSQKPPKENLPFLFIWQWSGSTRESFGALRRGFAS